MDINFNIYHAVCNAMFVTIGVVAWASRYRGLGPSKEERLIIIIVYIMFRNQ